MKLRPRRWLQSLHAKLFLITGLVTTAITVLVAYSITWNSREAMEAYTQNLAVQTAKTVETEIQERDPEFTDPRKIKEVLESLQGSDKSIVRIDVFRAESLDRVAFITSSAEDEEVVGTWMPKDGWRLIGNNHVEDAPFADRVPLELVEENDEKADGKEKVIQRSTGWRIYLPISNPQSSRPPIGLVRVYSDMAQWEAVWNTNLKQTIHLLPIMLAVEFVLLWLILAWILNGPLKNIMTAMARLERGDLEARANPKRQDELGRIADRFNQMAAQLQKAASEREALIEEIQGLNQGLQSRIDEALAELQGKNRELEELMEHLAVLREELAQQERLAVAGQLTAAFAHEVGTPLNLVNGHLQLLTAQSDLSDKARERLNVIQAQIQRVGDIVRKLLVSTRRPELQRLPLRLDALIADLQRLWNPTLTAHGIGFEVEAPKDCTLMVDRKQMEQLFINLVNNAADAMPHGGRIRLQLVEEKGIMEASTRWEVALSDTGAGIPPEVLPMVFKPMFTTKPEGKGTGLGLAISREIVRAHGGEIHIESKQGEGTTLRFTLPKGEG